jgi:membrane protease YdiL (CAAX protease family)
MAAFLVIFVGFGALGMFGLAGLIVAVALAVAGWLRSGLVCGSAYGGVYAETFALWLLVMTGLNFAANWLPASNARLLFIGGVDLLSLTVLAWPVWRGIPWWQVRQDLGLFPGRAPWAEPWLGLGCYAMVIPLMVVGLLVTLQLIRLQKGLQGLGTDADDFGAGGLPMHPIIAIMAKGNWWQRGQVLFLASFVAPIVEETMFRGVLYRHLREASSTWRLAMSVGFSAGVSSFIFAVIHPQGLAAVPPLMALAFGFSLAREWRATLVPSMAAHALNNSILVVFFFIALGD